MFSLNALRPTLVITALLALGALTGCAGGPQFETLAARVVSEKPVTLPGSAVLEVQLKDVSTGDVLASSRYRTARPAAHSGHVAVCPRGDRSR